MMMMVHVCICVYHILRGPLVILAPFPPLQKEQLSRMMQHVGNPVEVDIHHNRYFGSVSHSN